MKKIGRYLIEGRMCDESSLSRALERQLQLKENSVFKPLGAILTDDGAVAPDDLKQVLSRLHYDRIAAAALFKQISSESVRQILALAEHRFLPENSIIYHAGDPAASLFIIISGKIKIFRPQAEGTEKACTILTAGDCFGEIALLTGESHRTSAKTIEPVSLLVLAKENFNRLCTANAEVSMAVMKSFACRLVQKDAEIVLAGEKEKAYQQFVSEQNDLPLPELIGQTKVVNRLRGKIETAARNDLPVLIDGEPGTEMLVVAGNIHKTSLYASAPFLSMDAENIAMEGYGAILEADSGTLQLEMAQSSLLFGYEDSSFSFTRARGLGLLQICRQGTVVIRNIDKLTMGVQEKLLSFLRDGSFLTVGGQKPITSNARIIGATSVDLEQLAQEQQFNPDLLALLQSNTLAVPAISQRKSDLRLLVDFLIIMECFKTPDRKLIKGVAPEAYQRIMEYDWPGNMDELQIVIRRAINLAHSDYLMPEDIFLGMAPPEGKYTINLLQFDSIKKFFTSRAYPVGLQIVTAVSFSLIFLLAFAGNQAADSNISLLLVWGLWEPLLIISWFVGARMWCAACPMGALNDLLNRFGGKKLKVPAFIQDYGMYASAFGLAVIIWAEVATDMQYSPKATGFLLFAIAVFALLSGLLFERRVWCRYLCPLGTLGAVYSGCAMVEWRSNRSICNSTCKDNSCYKGDENSSGCPLYQGPFSLNSNQNCILCGNCVKVCPNDSPVFNLRIPGHELWAALKPEKVTAVFVPVILGTQLFRGFEHAGLLSGLESQLPSRWLLYGVLMLATAAISFVYLHISGAMAFGKLQNSSIRQRDLFIHAIIPLAFVYEFVYQLNPLLTRLGYFLPTLGRQFGIDLEAWGGAYQPGAIKPWQVFFLVLGIGVSMGFLKVLIRRHQVQEDGHIRYRPLRYLPVLILGGVYIAMFAVQ